MHIEFKDLPVDSKVWVYIANNKLNADQKKILTEKLDSFLKRWKSEGKEFKSAYQLLEDQILVVGGTASGFAISGCAMDALLKTVKKWEEELGVDFTTVPKFCYRKNEEIKTGDIACFKKAVEVGDVNTTTVVFDNTVQTLLDFQNKFEVQASACWHKRLLK